MHEHFFVRWCARSPVRALHARGAFLHTCHQWRARVAPLYTPVSTPHWHATPRNITQHTPHYTLHTHTYEDEDARVCSCQNSGALKLQHWAFGYLHKEIEERGEGGREGGREGKRRERVHARNPSVPPPLYAHARINTDILKRLARAGN